MIILIPSQMPQQDLGMIAQALMGQGFVQQPASERSRESHSIIFYTEDKTNTVMMQFYQDIGTLRVQTKGELADKICAMLQQYFEGLTSASVADLYDKAQSDMERRVYAILLVLSYENAATAMRGLHEKYVKNGTDAAREGIVQGLAFLETPDVGTALESMEAEFKDTPIAAMCRKGIDALSERGLIRESLGSFDAKIRKLMETEPENALDQIEKYSKDNSDAAVLRALHASILIKLGRADEAGALLTVISPDDPDAAEAFCERAKLREAQKFVDQAIRDIQCALACDPNNNEAMTIFKRLALLASHKESSDEDKLAELTKALEENADDVNLLCQRAECLIRLGEFEKGKNDAIHARKVSANDQRLPLILCEAYLGMGYLGSALEQATLAQKTFLPSQRTEAMLLSVRVLMAQNRIDDAHHAIMELPPELHDEPAVSVYGGLLEELRGNAEIAHKVYLAIPSDKVTAVLKSQAPVLYADAPVLRGLAGDALPEVKTAPASPLDREPTDPYFKRCRTCGALTMARRTFCKECGGDEFFA